MSSRGRFRIDGAFSMMHFSRRVAVAGLLAAGACATAPPAKAARVGPPMWRVQSKTAQVVLFGQFPIPKGVNWLTPEVEHAFAASGEVWFENPDFDPRTAGAAMQKRAALGGPKLGEVMSTAEHARLADVLKRAGRPPDAFDEQLVWQVYLSLSDIADTLSGMDPASMPERVLKPRAKAEGKAIRSEWASMEEIMEFSAGQTPEQQLQLLSKTLDEAETPEMRRADAEAWARGDISAAVAKDEYFRKAYPGLSARLVTFRNERWVPRVQDMLARRVSAFVCVGLGHLVGPDSIQAHLGKAGLKVERI
jgi:uncharacterized protein